jgi:hypothetical protein
VMEWCKLYATFATDPKVIGLSDKAFRRYVEGLCYVTQHESDGWIPPPPAKVRAELEEVGLLDEEGTIHNWDKFNPTKISLEKKREAWRERKRMSRVTSGGQTRDSSENPEGFPTSTSTSLSSSSSALVSKSNQEFTDFWLIFPRRVGKRTSETAFARACTRASVAEILSGAARYRDDPNREAEYTAHPTTWLNRDGWNDDDLPPHSPKSARHEDRAAEILRGAMREQA